jgi:hypothetical protein
VHRKYPDTTVNNDVSTIHKEISHEKLKAFYQKAIISLIQKLPNFCTAP